KPGIRLWIVCCSQPTRSLRGYSFQQNKRPVTAEKQPQISSAPPRMISEGILKLLRGRRGSTGGCAGGSGGRLHGGRLQNVAAGLGYAENFVGINAQPERS